MKKNPTVLVCNQKGGVGKSLIADELAFAMDRCGTPYNFVDLDDQGGTIHRTTDPPNPNAEITIVDTPGALKKDIRKWIEESDIILIPFRPTSREIPTLLRMMEITDDYTTNKRILFVMNTWNRYKASKEFADWLVEEGKKRSYFKMLLVPQSEMIVQASAQCISVVQKAPRSDAATSIKQVTNWVRSVAEMRTEPVIELEEKK